MRTRSYRRRALSSNEIVEIWLMDRNGTSHKRIAKECNRTHAAINTLVGRIHRYLKYGGMPTPIWEDGINEIVLRQSTNNFNSNAEPVVTSDVLAKAQGDDLSPINQLEELFELFQTRLVDILDAEASRRSNEKVKELREMYETELKRLNEVLDKAQDSSMIGVIKRSWGQK